MAAIVEDVAKFDLERFLSNLKAELPSYAIPLFVRVVTSLDITGGIKVVVMTPFRRKKVIILLNLLNS